MDDFSITFARQRYVVARSLLKQPKLSRLHGYALKLAGKGLMKSDDQQVPNTPFVYGDFFMDGLLQDLVPEIERISALRVFPTYSYLRLYKRGDVLRKHFDRPACEISISLCLGYSADEPWPISIEGASGIANVQLEPGDALVYRGTECAHWREALPGDHVAQVFLHYVDQNGPHSEWKFDKRPCLTKVRGFGKIA
jgi:hypothetical protein